MASLLEKTPDKLLLKRLDVFISHIFSNITLPSHDASHHRRVWQYALSLAGELKRRGFSLSAPFMQQLMIACMTHDAGLSVEIGEKHGEESRKICSRFLEEVDFDQGLRAEVLFAVEHHDNKEYGSISPPDSLFSMLSVADDSDAFGYTGLYRYLEIYSARGTEQNKIADAIIANATARFNHMKAVFGFLPGFMEFSTRRFKIVTESLSMRGVCNPLVKPSIIEIISSGYRSTGSTIETVAMSAVNGSDKASSLFFREVWNELRSDDMF